MQKAVNPFQRQRFFNRASQTSWQSFTAHRERVTARLAAEGGTGRSLCILGAGNCNDLDLVRLTRHWDRIRLVDIDAEAMQAGVANQFQTAVAAGGQRERIAFSACDLTGVLDRCHEVTRTPTSEGLAGLRASLTLVPAVAQLGERFHTVASTCLLSQLIGIFRHAVGETNPELRRLAELVRLQHLRTVAELTAPGGTSLFFIDFVSSESLPAMLGAREEGLPALLDQVVAGHGCFPGMNPLVIRRLLGEPPLAGYWAEAPAMSAPWVWDLGPRSYLVTAITGRRRTGQAGGVSSENATVIG